MTHNDAYVILLDFTCNLQAMEAHAHQIRVVMGETVQRRTAKLYALVYLDILEISVKTVSKRISGTFFLPNLVKYY